jgi:hypothetical protein
MPLIIMHDEAGSVADLSFEGMPAGRADHIAVARRNCVPSRVQPCAGKARLTAAALWSRWAIPERAASDGWCSMEVKVPGRRVTSGR